MLIWLCQYCEVICQVFHYFMDKMVNAGMVQVNLLLIRPIGAVSYSNWLVYVLLGRLGIGDLGI